ncbi:DUF935 family protein [Pseudomonas aeruginosa]|nr:DUF935 family protein [Pseudomonas aeruginosa]
MAAWAATGRRRNDGHHRGYLRQPPRTQQLRKQQTAHLAGLAKEFANHPAKGLTPAKLARILIEAEQGQLQAQAELFMDMEERDAHLFAEMSKRKRAVLGLDWTIEPPRNASAAEKADAEYLHELLLDLEGIEDLMLDCMDGVGHGYSAIELEWSLQDGSGCRRPSTTGRRAGFN